MTLPALLFIIKFRAFTKKLDKLGLLENDEHWNATSEEAAFVHSPRMLRDFLLSCCNEVNVQIYKSITTVYDPKEAASYPTEFLNSVELPGAPSHVLELKFGALIIHLGNLDPPSLCNGTRLSIDKLMSNVIEASILNEQAAGQDVFIYKIPIIPSDVPFQFKQLQFPIRLSFAMSIKRSQGC
ncbi:ATP-dependent DNA helicase [Trichonephila clavipes]|nr:ATP-dependent DNA helicase [Trichonephila clavipes]